MLPAEQASRRIQLPRSSSRLAQGYAHCRVLTSVSQKPFGTGFEGQIYPAGAVVDRARLPAPLVVLECAGPVDPRRGHTRSPVLWILWEWTHERWRELGRSTAVNWEWTLDLRAPAARALHPDRELFDVLRVGRDLAEGILEVIEGRLEGEREDLRRSCFSSLYDRLSARIAL